MATSNNPKDNVLEQWCILNNIDVFRGSEENLLERFTNCAHKYEADYIVRITGDCPFFSYEMADELIALTVEQESDYGYIDSSYKIPIGLKVSVIKKEVLELLNIKLKNALYKEHITLYIDEHLNQFRTTRLEPFDYMINQNARLTCDTIEDYLFFQKVISELGDDTSLATKEILNFLNERKNIVEINSSIKQQQFEVGKEF